MNEQTWSEALVVGVAALDGAHRVQAALVDAIKDAVSRGAERREVQELLLRLAEETSDHFATEHELMRATRFPDREAHVEEHDRLLQHVSALLTAHTAGQPGLSLEVARSLKKWLLHHIQGRDRTLAEYLRRSIGQ